MGSKRVLVVDDEQDMRIFVSTIIETLGLEPITAIDGAEALEKARTARPNIVILDVMMPDIEDGIETYRRFRTDETLNKIPIIMLSAIARKTFLHSIRMLNPHKGVPISEPEAYMEKPPDADKLGHLVSMLLPQKSHL